MVQRAHEYTIDSIILQINFIDKTINELMIKQSWKINRFLRKPTSIVLLAIFPKLSKEICEGHCRIAHI